MDAIKILETFKEDFDSRRSEARALMMNFLQRTGVDIAKGKADLSASKRYLWTDAFAVCNLLGLGEEKLALLLAYHVHHILGKHRIDGKRKGWLSGLSKNEGEEHPTLAGLRIGKKLPERGYNEPIDESVEWDRDGQYFHYLTKWMHALDQVARITKQPHFNRWASELAVAAHTAFTYHYPKGIERGELRMYWKMSIDLTYPLVFFQGQHDPVDGYITYNQLRLTAAILKDNHNGAVDLSLPCDQLETLVKSGNWATSDPLGIGCLLIDAFRVYQLMQISTNNIFKSKGNELLVALLRAGMNGIECYINQNELQQPAEHRLAFRELGLCIGLHAIELMAAIQTDNQYSIHVAPFRESLEMLPMNYKAMRNVIENFWRDKKHREGILWKEHQDINDVMLATCLVPSGFLILHDFH